MKFNKTLLGGSFILLITFNIFNFLNFLFQFTMVRMLTPADYGVLAALFSVIYIFSVFNEAIQTIITKYTSTETNLGKIKNLLKRSLRKGVLIALTAFLIFLIIAIPFAFITDIPYSLLALTGLTIFAVFLLPINRGVMQGRKQFTSLGSSMVIESLSKVILALIFVYILSSSFPEYKLYGAVVAQVFGVAIAILLSFFPLRYILDSREERASIKNIYSYSIPVFLATLAVVAFYSIDIIVAKIFFSSEIAGFYAIAAVLSKVVFWGTQPISKAMFPISSESAKQGKKSSVFTNSLALLFLILAIGLSIVFFFPELIIRVFSGEYITESSAILFYASLAIAILSISNLVLLYKLSRGYTKGYYWLFLALILEAIILSTFSENLIMFSKALIASALIFLLTSIIFVRKPNPHS